MRLTHGGSNEHLIINTSNRNSTSVRGNEILDYMAAISQFKFHPNQKKSSWSRSSCRRSLQECAAFSENTTIYCCLSGTLNGGDCFSAVQKSIKMLLQAVASTQGSYAKKENGGAETRVSYEFQMRTWLIRSVLAHICLIDFLKFILLAAYRRRCTINGNSIPVRYVWNYEQGEIRSAVFTEEEGLSPDRSSSR